MTLETTVRIRGATGGVAVFALVAGSLSLLFLEGRLQAGTWGTLVFGPGSLAARLYVLGSAALLAGVAASLLAGDYVGGTGLLAGAGGLLAVLNLIPVSFAEIPFDGLPLERILCLEVLAGLALLLACYTAAWVTALVWVLPRRPGPPPARKAFSLREILTVAVPCFLLVGLTSVSLAAIFTEPAGIGLPAGPAWFAATFGAALLVGKLFGPRSTFFVWTAPNLALVAILAAVASFAPEHVESAFAPLEGFSIGAIAPLGAMGSVLGYLSVRRSRPPL